MTLKEINPDIRITAEAANALVDWALEQMPPLKIIAACDRVGWWANRQLAATPDTITREEAVQIFKNDVLRQLTTFGPFELVE